MNKSYKNILRASSLIAISGILYGFLGYLGTNVLLENMSISDMLFWRFSIAGSWMLIFATWKYSLSDFVHSFDKRILIYTFLLGALGYAGSSVFYFIACQYTGTGLAMVIFFSYPIIIALMSWLNHPSSINVTTLFTLVMMTLGLFLLKDNSSHSINMIGIVFAIFAAICYAIYVVGSKRFSSVNIDTNILTIIVCFTCAVIFLVLSFSTASFVFPHSLKSWINLLALGILATAIPIQLMLEGLKHVSSMRASIISVLEPLMTVMVGVILLGESFSYVQIIGVVIILTSALLVQFQKGL